MKKILAVLCVIAMVLSCAACGASESKPESTVTSFCEGMKTFDFSKMQSCVEGTFSEDAALDKSEDMPESFYNSMKDYAKSISYTVGTATIEGDTAKVPVTFKYKDASAVITTALGDYMSKAIALVFGGGDTSDKAMSDLFISAFNDSLTKAEIKESESSVTFDLIKTETAWKIKNVGDDVLYILTSNIIKALSDFDEGTGDTSSNEPKYIGDPNFIWHDVAIGETAEFATLKLTLNGCTETKELKGSWDKVKADEGTKFVVFTYTVENTTKNEIDFSSSDFKLYDNQDRQFSAYEDAFWYNDEVLVYETLSPNMPKKAAAVYNIPDNAEGYFMVGGKTDTNEYFKMFGK